MGFDFGDTVVGRLLSSLAPDGKGNNGLHLGQLDNGGDGPDGPHHPRGGPHGNDSPHGRGNPHGHDGPPAPGEGSPRAPSTPAGTSTSPAPPQTGGPAQPQAVDAPPTGGPAPKGMQDVFPNIVGQLMSGARAFSLPPTAQGTPPAAAAANPGVAEAQQAAAAQGQARAAAAPAQLVASAMPTAPAAPATAAAAAPLSQATASGANAVAGMATPILSQPATGVPRTLGDGLLAPVPPRPADTTLPMRADGALLARLSASPLPLATAPPPTLAAPATLAAPGGTTAALAASAPGATVATAATTAAGLTMATSVGQPADARGMILPVNDRAAVRLESLSLAGHTLEGLQRRSMRKRAQEMLPQRMTRWLWAIGLMGAQVDEADADPERDAQRVLQWLFWTLAVVAYGCLAVAIIALVGSNGQLFDQPQGRSYTGWLALCGLAAGSVAWWLARRMSRR